MPTKVPNRKKKPGVLGTTTNGGAGSFNDSAMDEFLAKRGLYRKPIAKDGSCLFRAVSEQVHNCQAKHLDVRNQCIAFMRQNRELFEEFVEGPFDHHLFKLQNPKEWAGQVEITALSQMYRKDFVVYQDINSSPTKVTDHGYKDKIFLCYSNGNHYDIIYPSKFQEHAAMCQSLLYEMVYNKVFIELDKKEKKGKQKGASTTENNRNNQKGIMELVNGCMTDGTDGVQNNGDDDGWTEVKSKARAKHERLSKPVEVEENKEAEENKTKPNDDQKHLWELRRSIDPHLYRNIPLEVWDDEKNMRQQQDLVVAVTLQYKNNDRCLVKLGPPNAPVENYSAIVKEDYNGSGSVLVYIPELKEKQNVPIHCVKISDKQQGHNYKDLSGYYKKEESANGPPSEDGCKDDNKNKNRKRPPRNRRGQGKGGDETGNVSEDAPRRGRPRERYGNRRRFPNSKDDKYAKDEEEARFIAEQIKLVEIQEKDPKAFPALPARANAQVSPTAAGAVSVPPSTDVEMKVTQPRQVEEKHQEKDKSPVSIAENSPAVFWSRLKTKPGTEGTNQSNSPMTSPSTRTPETQPPRPTEEPTKKVPPPKSDEETLGKKEQQPQELTETKDVEAEPVKEKDALIDEAKPSSSNLKQASVPELENQQFQPAQLKPLASDAKHMNTTGQVFEVKISQPAKLMQTAKISPPSNLSQQPKALPQSPETDPTDENVLSSLVELQDKMTEPVMNKERSKDENEMIVSRVSETPENTPAVSSLEQPLELPPSNVKQINDDEKFAIEEESTIKEEEAAKVNKMKVVDAIGSGVTPERKTVTFAEKHKEIPAVPYGQSQKGILNLNGTHRPNQTGEQGYKSPNPEDYTAASKESKVPQDATERDPQTFPSPIANEGLQSTPSTQAHMQYLMPLMAPIPHGMQIPSGPSIDPSGADLPEDPVTLRYFYNLGYQQFLAMANQMNNQHLLYNVMYQGAAMQDQLIQPTPQPVVSLPQQQMYTNMHHQQLSYQHTGIQNYQPGPFQMPSSVPQTNQDSTTQHDRTSERTNHTQHQHQGQQMPHQQQSGHYQQQQQQQSHYNHPWRQPRTHFNNSNKPHASHHANVSQAQRFQYPNSVQRPYKDNNKQNRKPGVKNRNETYSPHYGNMSHAQGANMPQSQATPSHPTSYYIPGDQNKGPEYFPGNAVMYNYHHHHIPSGGIPPHSTVNSRVMYN